MADNIAPLQGAAGFYWRVAAVGSNNNPGPFSTSRFFNLGSAVPTVPGPPTLVDPGPGQVLTSPSVRFAWNAVPNATKYRLTFSTKADFTSETITLPAITATEYATPLNTGTYLIHWKVAAGNAGGYGADSPSNSFNVATPTSSVITSVTIDQPTDQYSVRVGSAVVATARFTGSYSGTVNGYWLIDGVARTDFTTVREGATANTVSLVLPTAEAPRRHTLAVFVTSPNPVQSRQISYSVQPGSASPAVKVALRSENTDLAADGVATTRLSAQLLDARNNLVAESRAVSFTFTSGATSASLLNSSATTVAGTATVVVRSTIRPGVVTISASSAGLSGGTATILVGGQHTRDLTSQYLSALSQLRLPLNLLGSSFDTPTKSYQTADAVSFVNASNSSDPRSFESLRRLMLAEKALYHFYGEGAPQVPLDKDLRTPGASQMLADSAEGLAQVGGLAIGMFGFVNALKLKAGTVPLIGNQLAKAADKLNEYTADLISNSIELAGTVALSDEELKGANRDAFDLMKDKLVLDFTDSPGTNLLETTLKTAAAYGVQQAGTAWYVAKTQRLQDGASRAARDHVGTGTSFSQAQFNVDSSINAIRQQSESAHIWSEATLKVGDRFETISEIASATSAVLALSIIGGFPAIIAKATAITSRVISIGSTLYGTVRPYRELLSIKNQLPAAVNAAFPGANLALTDDGLA